MEPPVSPRQIMTVDEMKAADAAAVAAGAPVTTLMERAGKGAADVIRARWSRRPVVIWCGPGDNGGDGYVIARSLRRRGWPVRVEALASPASPACRWAAERWRGEVHPLNPAVSPAELYVDALFGAGLSRPLEGLAEELARAAQGLSSRIVAVDTPSGVHGDTGEPLGENAFAAALTVTFHRRKPAHVLAPGRAACGEVEVIDIGLSETGAGDLVENDPGLWGARFPWPSNDAHKHARGRLVVVSGEAWSTGAARLSARAGLRVGAGVVTLLSPPGALAVNAAHLEAVMLAPFETDADLAVLADRAAAAVIGPAAGVGEATARNLTALAGTGAALVVDADALTSFAHAPDELSRAWIATTC